MDSLRDQTLLNSRHHGVCLEGSQLLLSHSCMLLLHLLLRCHHLSRIGRIFAAFRSSTLPHASFCHCFESALVKSNFQIIY